MFPLRSKKGKEDHITDAAGPIRDDTASEKPGPGRMELDPQWLSRIFTIIPVALILLAGASALWTYFFILSLLPDIRAEISMPSLSNDVRVVRDRHGVPGLIGDNELDLFHALGYVMAEDRLWQMDFLRRAATGRLSEIFGPEYLEQDHFIRSVLWLNKKELAREKGDKEQSKCVSMFVKGVNSYISSHYSKLPVEFSLLEYKPAPFTENDVIAITRALAWASSPSALVDPVMTRIVSKLGKKDALKLLPSDPAAGAPLIMDVFDGWRPEGYFFDRFHGNDVLAALSGLKGGSAWAVGGEKSGVGRTIICWNIQQILSAPRFWYRARLSTGDFSLAGAFIPGAPVAIAGANKNICWGAITAPIDDADLFLESVDTVGTPKRWFVDGWAPIKERVENYKPKGGSTLTRPVYYTSTGPIVSSLENNLAISLKWTGMEGANLLKTFYRLNRAANGNECLEAAKELTAPCMSLVWADNEHNFGAVTCGKAPLRPAQSDGIIPMPAWTGAHDWMGTITAPELPAKINPGKGALAVAQGRPGGRDYPVFLGCYWDVADLGPRIEQMLFNEPDHSETTFKKIQTDCFSPTAQALKPTLVKALKGAEGLNETEKKALKIFESWDCKMAGQSSAAAVYGLIYESLVRELFFHRLGEDLFNAFTLHKPTVRRAVLSALGETGSGWIDSKDRGPVLRNSFKRAIEMGASRMGSDPEDWQWANLSSTVFKHPLTSHSRLWELVYNVGPIKMEGSDDTINYSAWSFSQPFKVTAAVTLRQTAQMISPPDLMAISPMGVSGHFFSGHYKDQMENWLSGQLFRDPIQKSEIRKNGFDTALFKAAPATSRFKANWPHRGAIGPRESITESGENPGDPDTRGAGQRVMRGKSRGEVRTIR